jgi:outer membrane immunogenic protein
VPTAIPIIENARTLMKKLLIGIVPALALATGYGHAADLPIPYKAPLAMPSNWAGFYIGLNAGGGIANADVLDPDCFTCADTKFQSGFGTLGGQLGYNWQWRSVVLGLEGDINWLSVDESRGFALDEGIGAGTASFKFDTYSTIRGRAGLAVDRGLIYVTGGAAFGYFNSSTVLGNQAVPPAVLAVSSDNGWHTGLAAGAGLEFMVYPNWTLRGEYLMLLFPDVLSPMISTTGGNTCSFTFNCRTNFGYSANILRAGLSYKF